MRIKYIGNHTEKSKKLYKYINKHHPEYITEKNPELIIVAGGDGSMLHAIKDYGHLNIPFFGIGMGTLDFLMNEISKPEKLIKNIQKKKLDIIKANSMAVEVIRKGKIVYSGYATNDIMLGNSIMDYHKFLVNTEDASFTNKVIEGQSIIISTAIGSTAISLNNKGTVIPSFDLDMLIFSTVLAKVSDSVKKNILSEQKTEITILSERQNCKLFIDGTATVIELEKNDLVSFKKGNQIKLAFLNYKEFELKRLSIS